ncbi:hypothetical protein BJ138DRAFT_1120775 [Hygrophoropsis aurantiaca]|uniref:Uncharacterized protein n=1 Tax=Hygrophoropsis aurantiaca TaxID=72124 RepID=A0ACB7ZQI2_9AGAM|nr:hypothetical protein BJ138DRAFT_1120775 [Hygrophoropsis aurantiaca]
MPRRSALDFLNRVGPNHAEMVERLSKESAGFETVSISTQKKRKQMQIQIEGYAEDQSGIVPGTDVWKHPSAEKILLEFLTTMVDCTEPSPARKAKGHTHITWKTLKAWHFTLIWAVMRFFTALIVHYSNRSSSDVKTCD